MIHRAHAVPCLAALGAAGVLALSGPAFAVGSYTVTAGSQTSGTTTFVGSAEPVEFSTPGVNLSCGGSQLGGVLNLGTSDGTDVATVQSSSFTDCVGPLGIPLEFTHTGDWTISTTGTKQDGTYMKRVSNISLHVSNPDGQCDLDVNGSVDGVIDQTAQQFRATTPVAGARLVISNVSGCFGIVNDGDTVETDVAYDITTAAGPFAISES
ncbi:hypothetical protein GCM10011519_08730 [Marmoricola endophyticus]|uniref:Secreted protein n=1 Tax=Marmoricola endophyticus TaxID=2040280 RepID=A0A917BCS0_9ACTN|nr:hypothetical protein [Marmoricola endophyticus]GGF37443.1 hypothetical protein GCM10011519_08730 [Marmoricola endophyticus]